VSVELALAGIDPTTFDADSVAAGIAEAAGVDASDVAVTVADLPVSTTLSLVGSTTLSAAQRTAMTAAITASLPSAAQAGAVVTLGTPVAVRRRLLDLTVPVSITGLGAAASTASAAATALSSSASLTAFASAGGATSASATAPGALAHARLLLHVSCSAAPAWFSCSERGAACVCPHRCVPWMQS
jgi:hypothetical protein